MSMEIVSAIILATRGSTASCPHAFASIEGPNKAAPPAAVRPWISVRRDCQLPCFACIVPVLSRLDELGKFEVRVRRLQLRCELLPRRSLVDDGIAQHTDLL